MGNRLSGTLAILTMDRFECKYIYPVIKLTIYVRYVDDIGTTVQTIEEAHETLHMMSSKHPTLRFELEAPDAAGFLPILDVKIKAGPPPPWFEFLVIFDFFAPWYRRGQEASSVKIL